MASDNDDDYVRDLKWVYKRTKLYRNDLLSKVYKIVRNEIKKGSTCVSLRYNYEIPGSNIVTKKRYVIDKIDECDMKYASQVGSDVIVVNDESTRRLIDDVVIPLDLKWYVIQFIPSYNNTSKYDYEYHICVSWDHWE
jgi:hypothetical protein